MGTYETRKKKNSPSQPRHARSSYCTLRATKKPKYIITFLKDIFYKKLQQVVGVDFSPVELIITLRVFQVGLLHQILKCCGDQAILIKIDWSTSHFKKKATTNVSFFLFLITVWLNRGGQLIFLLFRGQLRNTASQLDTANTCWCCGAKLTATIPGAVSI